MSVWKPRFLSRHKDTLLSFKGHIRSFLSVLRIGPVLILLTGSLQTLNLSVSQTSVMFCLVLDTCTRFGLKHTAVSLTSQKYLLTSWHTLPRYTDKFLSHITNRSRKIYCMMKSVWLSYTLLDWILNQGLSINLPSVFIHRSSITQCHYLFLHLLSGSKINISICVLI